MVDKASHKEQPLNFIPGDVLFICERVRRILCACRVFACFEAGHSRKAAVSASHELVSSCLSPKDI